MQMISHRKFFEQFNHDNQPKATTRYRNIIHKWIPNQNRGGLLNELKIWNKSEKSVVFWNNRRIGDTPTVVESNNESNDEGIPHSRWIVIGVDASEMLLDFRNKAISMAKTQALNFEKDVTELAACFNMLLIIDDEYSNLQLQYFGGSLLGSLRGCDNFGRSFTMKDTAYLAISRIIYDIQLGALVLEAGIIELLGLSLKDDIRKESHKGYCLYA